MPSHNHAPEVTYNDGTKPYFTVNQKTSSDCTARGRVATSSGSVYAMTANLNASDNQGNDSIWESKYTTNTGSSQPHNNLPPYLSVYVFKRTA